MRIVETRSADHDAPTGVAAPRGAGYRQSILFVLKLVLGIAVLAVVFWQIDKAQLARLLQAATPGNIVLSIVALGIAVVANAHRWMLVTQAIGQKIDFNTSIRAYFQSMLVSQVLPTSIGGDAARVVFAVDAGVATQSAVIGILVDRGLGLCMLAACLVPAYAISPDSLTGSPTMRILLATSVVMLVGATAAASLGGFLKDEYVGSRAFIVWLTSLLRSFYKTLASRLTPFLVLDLIASAVLTLVSFTLCARAVNVNIAMWDALIVVQGMTLASIVPASIGGWGVREGAAVLLMAPLGIGADQALATSVLFGLSITALGLFGGVVWLARSISQRHRSSDLSKAVSP